MLGRYGDQKRQGIPDDVAMVCIPKLLAGLHRN